MLIYVTFDSAMSYSSYGLIFTVRLFFGMLVDHRETIREYMGDWKN
jgi:hypothetical protein